VTFSDWFWWWGAVEPGGSLRWLHWLAVAVYAVGALFFLYHSLDTYRRAARQEAAGSALIACGLVVLLARSLRLIPAGALAAARLTGSILAAGGFYLLFKALRRRLRTTAQA
jgi:hypothetical protein